MPLTNIKILMLNVNREGWHSGNMIYDMMVVKNACDTKMYGPGWPEYRYTDLNEIVPQLYGNDKPDIIYSYFTPEERIRDVYKTQYDIPEQLMNFPKNLDKIDVVKIFALSDFWARSPSQFSKDLKNSSFQQQTSQNCISELIDTINEILLNSIVLFIKFWRKFHISLSILNL